MAEHKALVGDNLHIARSLVGTGSPVGSVTPGIIGQFYINDADNSLWHATGLTSAEWVQTAGGGGGGTSIRSYGHFICALGGITGWGAVNWPQAVKRVASDFHDHPAEYWDCSWDMWEQENGGVIHQSWTDQQFASVADLFTFIRNNAEESLMNPGTPLYNIRVHCYDKVASDMPGIDKLYGMNTMFSLLRGRRSYRYAWHHAGQPNIQWSDLAPWFTDLCNQNCGFGPGHVHSPGDEAAIWFSRNSYKMYGLPQDGFPSEIMVGGGRGVWDWGSSSFTLATVTTHTNGAMGPTLAKIGCYFYKPTQTWGWFDPSSLSEYLPNLSYPDYSLIILYQLGDGTDPNKRALFVKPVGIDKVGLNWFDTSAYDLVASHTRRDMTPMIRKVTTFSQVAASRDLVWVDRTAWRRPYESFPNAKYSTKMVGFQPVQTRFFLRDKVTKEVSKVSHARIAVAQRQRGVPFKFEVRS